AALACYFLVSAQLNNQVNANLQQEIAAAHRQVGDVTSTSVSTDANQSPPLCQTDSGPFLGGRVARSGGSTIISGPGFDGGPLDAMIVTSNGAFCSVGGELQVNVSDTQKQIAASTLTDSALAAPGKSSPFTGVFYDTTATDGEHVRVLTISDGMGSGLAMSSIASLSSTDSALSSLIIWLLVAAGCGIALATVAGLVVARSAVRPLKRLTRAVEHVARTEDLSIKLPARGKDEIDRLSAAFNKMTRSLATSRDRQRRLVADAGHELRTPLTSLRANVDLLLRSERTGRALPQGRREAMLDSVDQQLHELSGLVTDLLELSRGQEQQDKNGHKPSMRVPLHESAHRALARAKLRGPGLTFDTRIEPWFVQGAPTAVDRAVVNLLDNAVKFSPPDGTVTVSLRNGELTVADQGPGIAPEDLPHVFERFWRSDSARALPGSGLGLAIVAQVAEDCGGKISLLPAPGGGTLARLWLPGHG
ncbi:MAG TPA: HAMP domain-containing sensor histidine kinase, partial [Acidothermaceae bacterium]|nr:HAMP domain-containing sensor histidine kinase [Acidothermaceae bacterium]